MDRGSASLDEELQTLKYALRKRLQENHENRLFSAESHEFLKARNQTDLCAEEASLGRTEGARMGKPWFHRLLRLVAANSD